MNAPRTPIAMLFRAHVFDAHPSRATHVSDPTRALATAPTLRYTLAGSPDGEPAAGRGVPCG